MNELPSYLIAADNHNVADGSVSWSQDAAGAVVGAGAGAAIGSAFLPVIGTGIGAVVGGILGYQTADTNGAYAAASVVSGAASFYNTGVTVANWFGADAEQMNVADTLTAWDTDFGAYYRKDPTAADVTGFVAGSFLPMGAVSKALNIANKGYKTLELANEGRIGANMSASTGLLASRLDSQVAQAAQDIATTTGSTIFSNKAMINAFATGVAGQAAEGALTTAAVYATMYQSPILNQSDFSDIFWGIATGGILQGALGGLVKGAESYGKVKGLVKEFEQLTKPYTSAEQLSNTTATALGTEKLKDLGVSELLAGKAQYADEILTNLNTKLSNSTLDSGFSARESNFLTGKISARNEQIANESTEAFRKLAATKEDETVSLMLNNISHSWGSIDEAAAHIEGLREVGRASTRLKTETAIANASEPVDGVIDAFTPEAAAVLNNTSVKYLGLTGTEAGKLVTKPGDLLRLADIGEVRLTPNSLRVEGSNKLSFKFPEKEKFEPLADNLKNLKQVEASYIWAQHAWVPPSKNFEVSISELHKASAVFLRDIKNATVVLKDGTKITNNPEALKSAIIDYKTKYLAKNLDKSKNKSANAMARGLDVSLDFINGTAVGADADLTRLAFGNYGNSLKHTEFLKKAGRWSDAQGLFATELHPSYAKLAYDTTEMQGVDGNVIRGMAAIKARQRIFQDAADRVVAGVLGAKHYDSIPDILGSATASKYSETQGVASSANGAYGSTGSNSQQVGRVVHTAAIERQAESVARLNSAASAAAVSGKGATEFQVAVSKLRATPEPYVVDKEAGGLVLARSLPPEIDEATGKAIGGVMRVLDEKAEEFIPLSKEALDLAHEHASLNAERVLKDNALSQVNGFQATKKAYFTNGETGEQLPHFYPPAPNPNRYPHFAFVTDSSITGAGHTSMIYAASPEELDGLISSITKQMPNLTIRTKSQTEDYYRFLGEFRREETITDNHINSLLARKGLSSNFTPNFKPDDIVNDLVDWHKQQDTNLVRKAVATKYSKEFNELNFQGKQFTALATSKAGGASLNSKSEQYVHNPFHDVIKQALDITNLNEVPQWTTLNNFVDRTYTDLWNKVKGIVSGAGKEDMSAKLKQIQEAHESMGLKGASYDAQLLAHANHPAGEGALKEFVAKQNAILATLTLRLDPINALNNFVGSPIITTAEMHKLESAILAKDSSVAGKLGRINFEGQQLKSPLKSYFEGWGELLNKNSPDMAYLREKGFASPRMVEVQNIIEDLKISGSETAKDFDDKIARAYDKFMKLGEWGELKTGNKLAEEANRLIAGHMILQKTKLAVEQGIMSEKEALPYINTFVNRTQGNYLASQRPLMFSGPVGGALGLFQTYQFNLMQQLLTHVADGYKKSAAVLLGMQSSIYGMHGMPAFDAINNHIIGTYSGNPNHRDLYDATYGVAGKEAGDFLMYGAASNAFGLGALLPDLKLNLYTRGDINPRFQTIVPVNPADMPIVQAWSKVLKSGVAMYDKVASGGNVKETFLAGIEHASLNRPLTGIVQTIQGYDTTGKGDMVVANDMATLATLIRVAGARPLDEAMALDMVHRVDAYSAVDTDRRQKLMEAVKTTVIGGNQPDQDQVTKFAYEYAKTGGTQNGFIRSMMQVYKKTNVSQANEIARQLRSPMAQSMQRLMGGAELKDLSNSPAVNETEGESQ